MRLVVQTFGLRVKYLNLPINLAVEANTPTILTGVPPSQSMNAFQQKKATVPITGDEAKIKLLASGSKEGRCNRLSISQ